MNTFPFDKVVILENDSQLKKILQIPPENRKLLAIVQYSGKMKKPSPEECGNCSTKFLDVLNRVLFSFPKQLILGIHLLV